MQKKQKKMIGDWDDVPSFRPQYNWLTVIA